MNALLIAITVGFNAQHVEVATVDDRVVSGTLVAIDRQAVSVQAEEGKVTIPFDSLLQIRYPNASETAAVTEELLLQLSDGSEIACKQVVIKDRMVVADTQTAGRLEAPITSVRSIRFRPTDNTIHSKWEELTDLQPQRDLLIVRNGEVLDRLEGTVSSLDDKTLTFLAGETSVPIDRTKPKLFGVIFSHSPPSEQAALCELRFQNGDRISVKALAWNSEKLTATLTAGAEVSVVTGQLQLIDFGKGKIEYLSQIDPREMQHTPLIGTEETDSVFAVRRDRSDAGPETPIRIDGKRFSRGLVIHSKTRLQYRLNGQYRRFVAVAGIEELVRPNGHVVLTITADGKELFSSPVSGTDAPIPIDLDVSGAREMTLLVDFGEDWDIADHLALGDARLIK